MVSRVVPYPRDKSLPQQGYFEPVPFFVSTEEGTNKPWKCRVHPPCFPIMSSLGEILTGLMLADIIPTFGSVNMIGGEMDR